MLSKEKAEWIKRAAEKYRNVPAPHGEDIDLNEYKIEGGKLEISSLEDLSEEEKSKLEGIGIDVKEESTSGSYLQINNDVVYTRAKSKVEILPISEALKKYNLEDYFWNLVKIKDKYTARVALERTGGFFIRVPKGVKETLPLQTCLLIGKENASQNIHNIVIVEEGAELNIITGCATSPHVKSGLHISVSEFYIKRNGKLTYTMIHDWGENVHVRQRTGVYIEDNGVFISNYVVITPVRSIQSYPTVYCAGENSKATLQTVVYGRKRSRIDLGSKVILSGRRSRADIVSRSIADDYSEVVARGRLVGEGEDVKGHLECKGLIISDDARLYAVPELDARKSNIELSHEAAVGKIGEEQLIYLMSRGLSEEEAVSLIIKGFLSMDFSGLPPVIGKTVKRIMDMTLQGL
ncbi:MAG TPA: SufD family Fe-S cluster assembly protein [Methanothermococcus okinawensis]|uniref:SufD family Fe-S cluster assembly protein n=1 Tax=Methanothermococcus okinawensis TaxID=155863 RepID=A0A832ZBU1_9EURY|nr:SufD family Fe-S cluster assembly protein [Methanothermococcus okinawensis]